MAIGQIVAWGTMYYAFSVMSRPIEADTGWPRSFITSGLSLGLLTWGIGTAPVGLWIQHYGGRGIMTLGSLLGGTGLILMGCYIHPVVYLIAWVALGIAMAALLYEPAFAVITTAYASHYRRGITLITLVGGLASTVFIPLTHFMVDNIGWRCTFGVLGVLQILVGVPVHLFGMPKVSHSHSQMNEVNFHMKSTSREWLIGLQHEVSNRKFWSLVLWFSAHTAAFSSLTFLLVPMYQSIGIDMDSLILAVALIGPMQVIGRLVLAAYSEKFSVLKVGMLAMTALTGAVVSLLILPATFGGLLSFAVLYGTGNGVMTILKATAVAELFGRERYAKLNGFLSAPVVLTQALAPLLLSTLWSVTHQPEVVLGGVLFLFLLGKVGLLLVHRCAISSR